MNKITQKLLAEEMIPIARMNEKKIDKLIVSVDGYEAHCFIVERICTDKIVIEFSDSHPKWGEYFTTKYYQFKRPGILLWGHQEREMKITISD